MTYTPQSIDASIESDRFFFQQLRKRTTAERLAMGIAMMRQARQFSLTCLRQQCPPDQLAKKLAQAWLQEDCPPNFTPKGWDMTWIQDSISLSVQLHNILIDLDIPYYVTGGVAAIAYGEPRTTRDADIVIGIRTEQIDPLVTRLELEGFYVPGVEDVRSGQVQTLGVTHIESIARADLILSGSSPFDRVKFERRRRVELAGLDILFLISAEDLILSKLMWGRGTQSEKQFRDVLGILKVQQVDRDYLREWGVELGVIDSLNAAYIAAGID